MKPRKGAVMEVTILSSPLFWIAGGIATLGALAIPIKVPYRWPALLSAIAWLVVSAPIFSGLVVMDLSRDGQRVLVPVQATVAAWSIIGLSLLIGASKPKAPSFKREEQSATKDP